MIVSYRDKRSRAFAGGKRVKAFAGIERSAQMKLDRLEAATSASAPLLATPRCASAISAGPAPNSGSTFRASTSCGWLAEQKAGKIIKALPRLKRRKARPERQSAHA